MKCLVKLLVSIFAALYGGEGINIPLRILPTKYIAMVLRRYGASISDNVRIRAPLTIHNSDVHSKAYYRNLHIASGVYIGRDCMIDLENTVSIGENATISHRVMFVTHTDAGNSPLSNSLLNSSSAPIFVESGTYIGVNVNVLQGVRIASNAVVAAGALLMSDVAPYSIVAGVPARAIRNIDE